MITGRISSAAQTIDLPIEVGDLVDIRSVTGTGEGKGRVTYIGGFILCFEGPAIMQPPIDQRKVITLYPRKTTDLGRPWLVDINGWVFKITKKLGDYCECHLHYLKPEHRGHVKHG